MADTMKDAEAVALTDAEIEAHRVANTSLKQSIQDNREKAEWHVIVALESNYNERAAWLATIDAQKAESARLKSALTEVLRFRTGDGEYNFAHLPEDQRAQGWDAADDKQRARGRFGLRRILGEA